MVKKCTNTTNKIIDSMKIRITLITLLQSQNYEINKPTEFE